MKVKDFFLTEAFNSRTPAHVRRNYRQRQQVALNKIKSGARTSKSAEENPQNPQKPPEENVVNEYEDPTSSKRATGDSAWSSPYFEKGTNSHDFQLSKVVPYDDDDYRGVEERKDEPDLEEGGPGSGRKKGSKNATKGATPQANIKVGSGMPSDIPDELPDDWMDMFGSDGSAPAAPVPTSDASHVAGGPDSEGDVDWSSLDDEDFLSKLTAGSEDKPTKPASPQSDYHSHDQEMSWDEFRATNPEEAAEMESQFPQQVYSKAKFKKKKSGFVHVNTPDGRRLFYMGDGRGWADMDDGGSPVGEF